MPAWDVEFWNYGKWQYTATGKVQTNSSINQKAGANNIYLIIIQDKLLTAYVNDKKLGVVNITKRTDGEIAYYAWQESGITTCTFANTWVWSLK